MRKTIAFIIVMAVVMSIHVYGKESELAVYLPRAGELPGWAATAEPEYAEGEDLFSLINGGAEVYHEYGFKQTITQGFKSKSGKSFNLEIYEMRDPAAAYGVYTFKTGDSGKPVPVDGEGLLEDYYLNFRKGNFLVTVIGFDSEAETITAIIAAAKVVASKMKTDRSTPELVRMLPDKLEKPLNPNSIKYLKGNLGLFNNYSFDSRDIFNLKEGVIGNYGDSKLYIFKYRDAAECGKWFEFAAKNLETNNRFKDFKRGGGGVSMMDEKGTAFYIEHHAHYIFIAQGKKAKEMVKRLLNLLSKRSDPVDGFDVVGDDFSFAQVQVFGEAGGFDPVGPFISQYEVQDIAENSFLSH